MNRLLIKIVPINDMMDFQGKYLKVFLKKTFFQLILSFNIEHLYPKLLIVWVWNHREHKSYKYRLQLRPNLLPILMMI